MAAGSEKPCPICNLDAKDIRIWDYGERISLECARCDKFTFTGSAAAIPQSRELGPKLSAWITFIYN